MIKKLIAISILVVLTSNAMAQTPQLGRVLIEYWTGVPGSTVSNLTNSANYPSKPNSREYSTVMEIPENMNTNSGDRMRGYLYVPETGTYTFGIASSDDSSLLFSTNSSPANATQIAYVSGQTGYQDWTNSPSQVSSPISLTAGQVCYLEALHKTGTGASNMSIGWQAPRKTSVTFMPASVVAP